MFVRGKNAKIFQEKIQKINSQFTLDKNPANPASVDYGKVREHSLL